jgi:hypothetical protein
MWQPISMLPMIASLIDGECGQDTPETGNS